MTEDDDLWVISLEVAIALALAASPLPWSDWAKSETAPAWVQAVGSIAAIGGAWLLTMQQISAQRRALVEQLKAQERARLDDLQALRGAVIPLLVNVRGRFVFCLNGMRKVGVSSRGNLSVAARTCNGAEEMMNAFPFHQLGDAHAISWFLEAMGSVQIALQHMNEMATERSPLTHEDLNSLFSTIENTANEIHNRMELFSKTYGFKMPMFVPIE
jgi:hypothetical protein